MAESSDKMRSTGESNGKPLQYSCLKNPINGMKRQKDMTPEDKPPSLFPILYWAEQRNSSRKKEEAGPKVKWCSVVDVSGGEGKVQCCKNNIA